MTSPSEELGLHSHFGPLEYAIMEACWSGPTMDVGECARRLPGEQAYTTVKTVMERLVKKGYLKRERRGKAYVYWPSETRSEVQDRVARRRSDELLAGFGPLAVSNFLKSVGSDTDRLNQLKSLLAEIEEAESREA